MKTYTGDDAYTIEAGAVRATYQPGEAIPTVHARHIPDSDAHLFEDEGEVTDAARGEAERLGIDVREVEGTGKGGRVIKGDVTAHAQDQ